MLLPHIINPESKDMDKAVEYMINNKIIGLANSQFDKVYSFNEYDLEVNTEELSSTEFLLFIKRAGIHKNESKQ
jgi:hypothetical protein